jgi:hypothetical protein
MTHWHCHLDIRCHRHYVCHCPEQHFWLSIITVIISNNNTVLVWAWKNSFFVVIQKIECFLLVTYNFRQNWKWCLCLILCPLKWIVHNLTHQHACLPKGSSISIFTHFFPLIKHYFCLYFNPFGIYLLFTFDFLFPFTSVFFHISPLFSSHPPPQPVVFCPEVFHIQTVSSRPKVFRVQVCRSPHVTFWSEVPYFLSHRISVSDADNKDITISQSQQGYRSIVMLRENVSVGQNASICTKNGRSFMLS